MKNILNKLNLSLEDLAYSIIVGYILLSFTSGSFQTDLSLSFITLISFGLSFFILDGVLSYIIKYISAILHWPVIVLMAIIMNCLTVYFLKLPTQAYYALPLFIIFSGLVLKTKTNEKFEINRQSKY